LASLPWHPNGIGFGLEDDALYVADTRNGRIVRFPLRADGLGEPETAAELDGAVPDGFAFDVDGNVLVAAQGGPGTPGADTVQTFSPDGDLLDVFDPGGV